MACIPERSRILYVPWEYLGERWERWKLHVYHRFAWNEKIWINLKVELEAARNYTFVIASWKSAWKIRTDPLYKKSLSNNLIPNSHPISNHHHPTVFSKSQNSHFQIHSYYSYYSRFRITRQLFSIILLEVAVGRPRVSATAVLSTARGESPWGVSTGGLEPSPRAG